MSNIDERVSVLETKIASQERRLRKQEENNEKLNEISTYVRLQYEHNKRQDEKIDKISKQFEHTTNVLDGINTSLFNLNHDVKQMKYRHKEVDDRVEKLERERIKEEQELIKELQDAKKDRKKFALKIVSGVTVAVITTAVLVWLGLN